MQNAQKGVRFYMGFLWRFSKRYWVIFGVSIGLTLLYATSNVYIMPLVQDLVREVSNKNLATFSNHVINAFLLFSVRLSSKYIQMFMMQKVSIRILQDMRLALFKLIHYMPTEDYNDKKHGDLVSRMMNDTSKVQQAIFLNFETFLPSLVTLFGVVGYLFSLNWLLTLLTIVGAPIFFVTLTYFSRRLRRVTKQLQQYMGDITQIIQESMANMKVIKIYQGEERNINRFIQIQQRFLDGFVKEIKFKIYREQIDAYMQFAIFLAVFWFGGYLVLHDQLSGANFVAFFTGIILLVDPVVALTKVYSETYQISASIDRLDDLLKNEEREPIQTINIEPIDLTFNHVEFKDVSFAYPNTSDMVVKQLSFSVSFGSTIGIVGPSGAGKSTIINLLNKFYLPTSGCVRIDGHNISELSEASIRQHIAYVPQESILFRGTILDNCRIGRPEATSSEVIDALKIANAWDFVNDMPEKLLTKMGTQGLNLSGGQRQRISIARAIVSNPKLLILDEATSALDSNSEGVIQESIQRLKGQFTMIIIAHRFSTIVDAEHILVMDQGRIVEEGTHHSLIKNNGLYHELIQKQTSVAT